MVTKLATRHSRRQKSADQDKLFEHVREALAQLEFGTITLVIQNGRVVQIERHEKRRLIPNEPGRSQSAGK